MRQRSIIGSGIAVPLLAALKDAPRGRAVHVKSGNLRGTAWTVETGIAVNLWVTIDRYEHGEYRPVFGRHHYQWHGYVRSMSPADSINRIATDLWMREQAERPLRAARESVYQLAESKEIDTDRLPEGHTHDYMDMSLEDCAFWTEWLNKLPAKKPEGV